MAQPAKIIVGLGNPGADYSFNRHNIGFMAVDVLAKDLNASAWQKKFKAQISTAQLGDNTVLLLKPQTFMNLSGEAVGEAVRYYKLDASDVIVLHDDIDLSLGQVKAKIGGGHGGHNGLKSLDAHIGKEYWRVRLGVGHPGSREQVTGHVLGNFSKPEMEIMARIIGELARALPLLLRGDQGAFIQKISTSQ
ncbi:MAG: aminoacyl-tRNA hydrolase [Bdellovibrionales bacterium]